jgi:hypothetical protein
MVIFKHPEGETARGDRYAWYNSDLPESQDPRSRLKPKRVLELLSDGDLAALYQRSMPVYTQWPSYVAS